MGPGQKFLTRVGLGQFFVARVGSGQPFLFGLEFRKFPLKTANFSIFFPSGQKKLLRVGSESTRVKAGSASYLLWVKSKLGSGRVGSGPISSLLALDTIIVNKITLQKNFILINSNTFLRCWKRGLRKNWMTGNPSQERSVLNWMG